MSPERRGGGLLVRLGPALHARPEQLLRQRPGRDGRPEYLVRWRLLRDEEWAAGGGGGRPGAGGKAESVAVWMSAEEVCGSCPELLGSREPCGQRREAGEAPGLLAAAAPPGDAASLLEMEADVRSLVRRAARQLASVGAPAAAVLNTVHVLSAYAGIGTLAGVFRETGALELLVRMLCHEEQRIRRGAGKMLRALASHDAGSRAYVLLSLSQQDGIEQHMDFDSRYILLELFAETMSSEEHCMSFEGVHLPQVPGKLLFTLVKRYLCVTSLVDELVSGAVQGGERQDGAEAGSLRGERSRVKQEFELSMAMASLILELVRVMGWEQRPQPEIAASQGTRSRAAHSIFQPKAPACPAAPMSVLDPDPGPWKKQGCVFTTPSDFSSHSSYAECMQTNLVCGIRVRMLEDYGDVRAGDEGVCCQSTNGTEAVQVLWQSTGRTCWVHWHMLEIIDFGDQRKETAAQEKVYSLTESFKLNKVPRPLISEPSGELYSLPYTWEQPGDCTETLSRAEWWELLFFVRKLEAREQDEISHLVEQEHPEQPSGPCDEGLIQLSVPVALAQKVLRALEQRCQGSTLSHLRASRVYAKYLLGRGAERDGGGSPAGPSQGNGSSSPESAGMAQGERPAAALLPRAPSTAMRSDSQLFSELCRREGLFFPKVTEEQSKLLGSSKGGMRRGSLAKLVEVTDSMQRSDSEEGLRLAGLQHMLQLLEEEAGLERHVGKAPGGPGAREKVLKVLVELLSAEASGTAEVALALRLLAVLMAKCEWRVPFATAGGVRAVLGCMQQHAASAAVQQAGLVALRVLVGGGSAEPGDAAGKPPALSCADAQVVREIFASIGSASDVGPAGLLGAIAAATSAMRSLAGGSSGVCNGLLVLNMLLEGHRGLAEQLANCGLAPLLRSCWLEAPSPGCPSRLLALSAMNRLAEHEVPLDPGLAGGEAALELGDVDVRALMGVLGDDGLRREALVALERHLCRQSRVPAGRTAALLQDRECFALLLRALRLLAVERPASLSVLRILNKCLDEYQEDVLPWHECVEPCLSSLRAHSNDQEVAREAVGFLHRLAHASQDCAVAMCCAGAPEALGKAVDKHGAALPLAAALRDLLGGCEKPASLYRRLTGSVLAGCIQLVLGQIEEHRRSLQPISIPFLDVFLCNLCRGCSVEVKEDKCWKKVQVSSNPHRASKLTDGNPKSYWESNGSTGSHSITVHMQCGVVIREMSMLVASEDSSYMPARVVVLGGESPAAVSTVLNAVTVLPSDSRVTLLQGMSRFWPVIQIRVKRCQQGGIDTRVRGIEVLGPRPTLWPVFKEQLCQRTSLLCSVRAHVWCREVGRERGRLLHLSGRLSQVLRHEQAFAERFLPDAEAAQALGRTFWAALVTPLVQSITSPDASGISPLAWLLRKYVESGEAARGAPRRSAVFSCRVRRLTRLLVHAEPGGAEPEEAQARGSNGGQEENRQVPARTAAAVTEKPSGLWGIARCWRGVVQQQVQRLLEAAWRAPDVVPRYCGLYWRLRSATAELFGQRAACMLALARGFAGALLHLSFPATLHVSERFARYLDGQVRELRGAAGSAGPLQRLLEPFVMLCGLELAHPFEHFYRYYLGDRLLAQGPSWLEGAVVEQLALCFPSRFPQQMLSNVAEAEELQQQFQLFQLQEQDRQLLELGSCLESPEDEVPGEVPVAPAPEVKVLVLSPRCWPVSPLCYLDEPGRFFPGALSSSLAEFADFWGQRQRQPGGERAEPRRLQWTWLGHAEVHFGDCVLHVSTLQMYVLLRFNGAEEVAVDALLQATGLPAELLQQALAPLTCDTGVLVQSCMRRGALRLNRAALARASGRCLRLLPQQTYLRAETAAASGALERKRNVLCCLIARILKAEKQLHVDNLVFRVLDACRKGSCGPGPQLLRFCCHSVDVLSCILHLLHQGCLRRQQGQPQVLEYASAEARAPLGGQAQAVFWSVASESPWDEDNVGSPCRLDPGLDSSEEFLMTTLHMPMGHTLSPEEAKLLMTQAVQQVQDTLSIPSDIAQHLLMHCRWNVDFLIQCYVEDCEKLLFASGLQVQGTQRPPSPGTHCPVCMNQLCPTESPPTLCCMHYCCKPCWSEYLTTCIEQNTVLKCTCPISECCARPTAAFIRSVLSSEEVVAKYEKAILRGYVECCSNLTWCTNPQGCDQILCKDGLGYGEACSKCSWISCFSCSFPEAHYPASCNHMSQWVDDDGYYEGMTSEAQSKHLAKLISKHCPNCQAQIEKNEGCLHMTCAKCNHGFCWHCLKPWRPTHKDYYNCSAMVSKAARQEKRFQDYNERCTFHHQAREFATSLRNRVSSINKMPEIRTLAFVLDTCKALEQARKVLAYSCVYSYYSQDTERVDTLEEQIESLELHTNTLQILLEEVLLQCQDLAYSLQLLKAEHFSTGLELSRRIQERLFAILWHSTQDFCVGLQALTDSDQSEVKISNVPAEPPDFIGPKHAVLPDSPDTDQEEDEECEPQWQEDYDDDDDLDEDNFLFDDESDNLDHDSYFDDDDVYD
ncbi:cullin-9-like [Eudromia elegans]